MVARAAARTTTLPEHVRSMKDIATPEAVTTQMAATITTMGITMKAISIVRTDTMDMADITTGKKSITGKDTTKPDWGGE